MRLNEVEKEKVRFHLGYVEGGPSSSRTVLEYRMNNLRSHQHRQLIQQDIARCDYALERLGLDDQATSVTSSTITVGDLDRSTTVYGSEPRKRRQKAYHEACALMAMHLGVEVLLGDSYQWQYTLEEIKLPPPPGPADTIIESKIRSSRRYI
jgi:hypothetical protein